MEPLKLATYPVRTPGTLELSDELVAADVGLVHVTINPDGRLDGILKQWSDIRAEFTWTMEGSSPRQFEFRVDGLDLPRPRADDRFRAWMDLCGGDVATGWAAPVAVFLSVTT